MITAIINQLKTGSIQNVFPRGQNKTNPNQPYVVVWKNEPIQQGNTENGLYEYVVNAHFPKGHINQLDDYIELEMYSLLNKKTLETKDGRKVPIWVTSQIGRLVEGNDDGTISKERICQTVMIWR